MRDARLVPVLGTQSAAWQAAFQLPPGHAGMPPQLNTRVRLSLGAAAWCVAMAHSGTRGPGAPVSIAPVALRLRDPSAPAHSKRGRSKSRKKKCAPAPKAKRVTVAEVPRQRPSAPASLTIRRNVAGVLLNLPVNASDCMRVRTTSKGCTRGPASRRRNRLRPGTARSIVATTRAGTCAVSWGGGLPARTH